ncbi:hypothetical protein E4U42_004665 [Claviceps africana]|uniref:Uncharacterized protein n=1 Tax=Claviceps africana TaxID=83212 RepID=A0A8K0J4N6_9HYPO|nr:hypothetical protein E4U42_004665 [Claviceps africana]
MTFTFFSSICPADAIRLPLASVPIVDMAPQLCRSYTYALSVPPVDILQRRIGIEHGFALADVFPILIASLDVERDGTGTTQHACKDTPQKVNWPLSPIVQDQQLLEPCRVDRPVSTVQFGWEAPRCASSDLLHLLRMIETRIIEPILGLVQPSTRPIALKPDSAESSQQGPSSHRTAQNVTLALYASILPHPMKMPVRLIKCALIFGDAGGGDDRAAVYSLGHIELAEHVWLLLKKTELRNLDARAKTEFEILLELSESLSSLNTESTSFNAPLLRPAVENGHRVWQAVDGLDCLLSPLQIPNHRPVGRLVRHSQQDPSTRPAI